MRGRGVLVGLFIACGVLVGSPAHADDAPVLTSDEDAITMTASDSGGATASVSLLNPGPAALGVTAEAGSGAAAGCVVEAPDGAELPAHREESFTITFSAACDVERAAGTAFVVTVDGASAPLSLVAKPPPSPSPDWSTAVIAYVVGFVVSLLTVIVTFWRWRLPEHAQAKGWWMPLPGLDATWKFADGWATNATVLTTLVTGVFGADKVTEALLGTGDAPDVLAVSLVVSALSLGLAGLSPMVVQVLRRRCAEVPPTKAHEHGKDVTGTVPAGLYVTSAGLLAGAVVTLTATSGQLASILLAVLATDFASDGFIVAIGAVGASVLLGYAVVSTHQNLTTGATPPPPDKAATDPEARRAVREVRRAVEEADGGDVVVGQSAIPAQHLDSLLDEVLAPARPGAMPITRTSAIL